MKLCDHDCCTGCGACAAKCPVKAIEMKPDRYGFKFPAVNDSCVNCGLCEKTCPVINGMPESELVSIYSGQHHNNTIRAASSSGGAFTAIVQAFQPEYVYGAAWKEDFSGVEHICTAGAESIAPLRGAKYVQSDLSGVYQQIETQLKAGSKVLFSGTPCQVAGIKACFGTKYAAGQLLCVDCICHGVPAPEAWKAYVRYRAAQDADTKMPIAINMRAKKTGWSHYGYSVEFTYPDGICYSALSGKDPFMRLFTGDYINRLSCSTCPFKGLNHPGDLTLGDFWGIWNIAPELDDNKGYSIVTAHNKAAEEVLKKAGVYWAGKDWVVAGEVKEPARISGAEAAFSQNPAMLKASAANEKRTEALTEITENHFETAVEMLPDLPAAGKTTILSRIKRKIKSIIT